MFFRKNTESKRIASLEAQVKALTSSVQMQELVRRKRTDQLQGQLNQVNGLIDLLAQDSDSYRAQLDKLEIEAKNSNLRLESLESKAASGIVQIESLKRMAAFGGCRSSDTKDTKDIQEQVSDLTRCAEENRRRVQDIEEGLGPMWAMLNGPRRFITSLSLDHLRNIVKGHFTSGQTLDEIHEEIDRRVADMKWRDPSEACEEDKTPVAHTFISSWKQRLQGRRNR